MDSPHSHPHPQQQLTIPKLPSTHPSRYSHRIILKSLLNRSDNGLGMLGERLVIGGWVKFSKELEPLKMADLMLADVTCVQVIQSRIPFLRSIIKAFGGQSYNIHDKLESIITKSRPPPP